MSSGASGERGHVHLIAQQLMRWYDDHPAMKDYSVQAVWNKFFREVAELRDAVSKEEEMEESADVFICLLRLVYQDMELRKALLDKIEVNARREWRRQPDGTWQHV